MKELEGSLGRAKLQASEMEQREESELRRVTGELEVMRKMLSDREVRLVRLVCVLYQVVSFGALVYVLTFA